MVNLRKVPKNTSCAKKQHSKTEKKKKLRNAMMASLNCSSINWASLSVKAKLRMKMISSRPSLLHHFQAEVCPIWSQPDTQCENSKIFQFKKFIPVAHCENFRIFLPFIIHWSSKKSELLHVFYWQILYF